MKPASSFNAARAGMPAYAADNVHSDRAGRFTVSSIYGCNGEGVIAEIWKDGATYSDTTTTFKFLGEPRRRKSRNGDFNGAYALSNEALIKVLLHTNVISMWLQWEMDAVE